MNKIDEIAMRVWYANNTCMPADGMNKLKEFAHTLLAELSKDVEPVATKLETMQFDCFQVSVDDAKRLRELPTGTKLFTHPAPVIASEQKPEWSYCPECGSEEIHYEEGGHKQCNNCHQEWFSTIDYSNTVKLNLQQLFTSPPNITDIEQKPVAWVDVIDRHEGPYNFNGLELLDSGKHLLFTTPPNTADIEQRVAEAWYDGNKFYANEESASMACADMANLEPLFTLPPTAEQIEQATAESIAKMIQGWSCTNGPSIAEAIRSGKWREYL